MLKVVSGDLDVALGPANVASVLYNKTEGGVQVVTHGIIDAAPVAEKALPGCNLVCFTGDEMHDALSATSRCCTSPTCRRWAANCRARTSTCWRPGRGPARHTCGAAAVFLMALPGVYFPAPEGLVRADANMAEFFDVHRALAYG